LTNWPWWHPTPPASSSTVAVFIVDRPSRYQIIHRLQPLTRVWGPAAMYFLQNTKASCDGKWWTSVVISPDGKGDKPLGHQDNSLEFVFY
jgi:hypothetical protein